MGALGEGVAATVSAQPRAGCGFEAPEVFMLDGASARRASRASAAAAPWEKRAAL
jgi:hypothetical protein